MTTGSSTSTAGYGITTAPTFNVTGPGAGTYCYRLITTDGTNEAIATPVNFTIPTFIQTGKKETRGVWVERRLYECMRKEASD